MPNAGIVLVNKKLLAEWLGLPDAVIHRVMERDVVYNPVDFEVVVEHPSMPKVETGYMMPHVGIIRKATNVCEFCGSADLEVEVEVVPY